MTQEISLVALSLDRTKKIGIRWAGSEFDKSVTYRAEIPSSPLRDLPRLISLTAVEAGHQSKALETKTTTTPRMTERLPLLGHPIDSPTAFSPQSLVDAVRAERRLEVMPIPEVCVLEFDGDLTDWLVSTGLAKRFAGWACFHTTMYSLEIDGMTCGVVPRTIGGPYAVLIAEQMAISGARLVLGLTSAGRIDPSMPVPSLAVATRAVRDEGHPITIWRRPTWWMLLQR